MIVCNIMYKPKISYGPKIPKKENKIFYFYFKNCSIISAFQK